MKVQEDCHSVSMARLAWDQSFLDHYSDQKHAPAVLETSSSDPVLLSYSTEPNNNGSYSQNFNSNPFLDKCSNELLQNNMEIGRIYQNLLCFHNYINTNFKSPYPLNKKESASNQTVQIPEVHEKPNLSSDNVHKDHYKITTSRLKHLLEEINRKKSSQCQDNTYLSSSHLISSYCHNSTFHNSHHPLKADCSCLKTNYSDELENLQHSLPSLNNLNTSQNSLHSSSKYRLLEIIRNHINFKTTHTKTETSHNYVNFRKENTTDRTNSKRRFTDEEIHILKINLFLLLQCGFYQGKVSSDEASSILSSKPVGTFFLRDSSNPNYLLSLSFKTTRGPTSIRILFQDELFSLETDLPQDHLKTIPRCNSILRLIQHFVQNPNKNTLEESSGRCDTPLFLQSPFLTSAPSLAHLARLKVNKYMDNSNIKQLNLDSSIEDYLKQYPYCV